MPPGTIIMLNGTSSSGKSSIVKALQTLYEPPFLEVGLDKFIFMLPSRYLNRPLWDEVLGLADRAGPMGQQLMTGMHQTIDTLARAGNHLIADHVLVEPTWVEECSRLFSDLPAYLIGIHCPLAILEQREKERQDRTLGQARTQFGVIHAYTIYDLELDTSLHSPSECAAQIKAYIETNPPTAFKQLKQRSSRR
jgi:chloramphenicol 3-O phosphotransferase